MCGILTSFMNSTLQCQGLGCLKRNFIIAGLEIAHFFPLRLKYLEKSQICDFFSSSLFRNKGLAVATLLLFLLK